MMVRWLRYIDMPCQTVVAAIEILRQVCAYCIRSSDRTGARLIAVKMLNVELTGSESSYILNCKVVLNLSLMQVNSSLRQGLACLLQHWM